MNNITEKYTELREELNNKDPLHRYAKLKEELDQKDPLYRYQAIKEEIDKIKVEKEEKTLESLENLLHGLGGEKSDVESKPKIIENVEEWKEIVVEEPVGDVEKVDIQEEPPLEDATKQRVKKYKKDTPGEDEKLKEYTDTISKLEDVKEKTIKEDVDPVSERIEKLEKHIQKIALAGPGSGEVRILNMDDVDTTDLANNKYLKYNSSTGKFVFATVSGGGGGSAHTMQNAGSDLTDRTNLNFDGTYVIATDDSGNDQTDIALSSALQSWHGKSRPSGDVIGTSDSQTLTNKTLTSAVLNTGVSGTAVLDEDNMATDSATQLATQQSIKAYVDGSALSLIDEDDLSTDSATRPPSQQSVKAYVDTQIATEDTLAELNDTSLSSPDDGDFLVHTGSAWVNEDGATARASLGVTIGTNVQAYDADLAAIAGLTSAADKGIQFTGSGTAAVYDLTTAGKALLDDANASAQRTTLGLGTIATVAAPSGTVVGTSDSQTLTSKTLTSPVLNTGVSGTAVLDEDDMATDSATQLATQQSIKAYVDAQILTEDTIAELNDTTITSASDGHFLVHTGSAWVNEAAATALASLGVTSTAAELNLLDGVSGLVQADLTKLAAVDATAAEINIIDGGTSATSTTVVDADRVVMNDDGTMVQVAVTDLAAYFDDEITAMPNLVTTAATTVGALNSGSITSGFGTIDTGSSSITTTGTVTGGTLAGTLSTAAQGSVTSLGTLTTLTVDNIIINGTNIGHTSDTDAIAIASSGNVTVSQDLSVSGDLTVSGTTTTVDSTVLTVVDPIIHLQTASGGGALGSDTNKDVGLALQYHTGSAAKTAFLGYDDSAGKLTFIPDATLSSEVVSGTVGSIVANLEGNVTGNINGDLTGTLQTAAQGNVTSLGTLTTLTVDNVLINGTTIGHTSDTDLLTLASGIVTVAGELQTTTLDIGGTNVTSTAAEINLIDGGTSRGTTAVASGDGILINDDGTMRMTNVDTVSTYFASHSVGGGNIVTTGALNSGSITSGFGTIDTGSSTITTTGLISGGSLDIDNVLIDGTTIGHTDDTDLMTVADGLLTIAGEISVTTLDIGGTNVTSTAAELNKLDGMSGTAVGTTDTQTMTNKTLTSPVLNSGVSGSAVLDEDDMASDSATKIATQQSIKAYTDTTSSAMAIALG